MTPRFTQTAQQADRRWPPPVLPCILAAVSLIATIDVTSLAAAAECQGSDVMGGNTTGEMGTWKGTTLTVPPLTLTVERDIFGALEPFPVVGGTPSIKSSQTAWGNTESQLKATSEVCGGQSVRKDALFNQAILRSIVKTPFKANTQFKKAPPLLYNGKRQTLRIRTTLPEIEISPRYQTTTIIGPVMEIPKPGGSTDRTMSQTVTVPPSTVQSSSALGSEPLLALSPFENALQLPVNESLRMNLTTTHALQGGNCASGCP